MPDFENSKSELRALQSTALGLWKEHKKSVRELGEAFIKVRDAMEYGAFGAWLKTHGIPQNRASYCMRVATGKEGKKAQKKPKPVSKNLEWKQHKLGVNAIKLFGDGAEICVVPGPTFFRFATLAKGRGMKRDELLKKVMEEYLEAHAEEYRQTAVAVAALEKARDKTRVERQREERKNLHRPYKSLEEKEAALAQWREIYAQEYKTLFALGAKATYKEIADVVGGDVWTEKGNPRPRAIHELLDRLTKVGMTPPTIKPLMEQIADETLAALQTAEYTAPELSKILPSKPRDSVVREILRKLEAAGRAGCNPDDRRRWRLVPVQAKGASAGE
jgi:hypothetical protein